MGPFVSLKDTFHLMVFQYVDSLGGSLNEKCLFDFVKLGIFFPVCL